MPLRQRSKRARVFMQRLVDALHSQIELLQNLLACLRQFAALLRTLSKEMGRQVVIAVHERALFEYLALELSPSFEGDRLITVELSRALDGQSLARWEIKTFVPDKAIAA